MMVFGRFTGKRHKKSSLEMSLRCSIYNMKMVWAAGFEPATSCSQGGEPKKTHACCNLLILFGFNELHKLDISFIYGNGSQFLVGFFFI